MKKHSLAVLFAILLLSFSSAFAKSNLKDDMKSMMLFFEGRFDNYFQTWEEKESKSEFPHEHIHSIFAKVNLPAIGENVFYVQQYFDNDPSKIYRQRLYNFTENKKEKAVQLTIYNFDDEKKYKDSHLDSAKLNGLTFANLKTTSGCEVYWKREGEKFIGTMKKDACKVVSQRSGKTLIITDDLFLTKDEIWINDQAKDEQGNYIFGNKSNVHHKLKRVHFFEGWTAVLKNGTTPMLDSDAAADDYAGQTKLSIHDQGDIVKINDKYSVQLARLVYKNGTKVLKLGIIDNATGKTVSYTWTNPEAEKIGINLRWVQAGFTLKK
jgi:CpeT/CpcT family (DUF1001)